MWRWRRTRPALLMLAALAVGCNGSVDDLPREAVSGTVTLDGQPLEKGMIQLIPAAGGGGSMQAGGSIQSGSYSIPKPEGPVPGKYTVVITAAADVAAPSGAPGEAAPIPKERIPAKYNTKSTLSLEVKPGVENHANFELQKP